MSCEGTLLFGSLLMSLVTLVGGALFYMRPDGVMALLILLFWSGGCGSGSLWLHWCYLLLVTLSTLQLLIWSLKSSIPLNQAWHFMALSALRTVGYSCSSLPSCLEKALLRARVIWAQKRSGSCIDGLCSIRRSQTGCHRSVVMNPGSQISRPCFRSPDRRSWH